MSQITRHLRAKHREMMPHIEDLQTLADTVGDLSPEDLSARISQVYDFLAHQLIPHAQAEDRVLYPKLCLLVGTDTATAPMQWDHGELSRLTQELAVLWSQMYVSPAPETRIKALRSVLIRLYELMKGHLAKAEEVYLPLLDTRLTDEEGRRLFDEMESATREARLTYWAT